jgi:hypothetical protein
VKPNYSFQKRQREIAKKQKKEEKRKQKMGADEPAVDVTDASVTPPPVVEKSNS